MTHMMKKRTLLPAKALDRPGRWQGQFTRAALATLCVSISTTVWADTESFDLSGFDGISAAEGIHVQVTTGEAFEITAESKDDRQLELLELDVLGGILRAQMGEPLFSDTTTRWQVTIHVTMPNLIHAEVSSGAEIMADEMSGSALEIASSSGSRLQINAIDGGMMSAHVSSGAEITIASGACTSLIADVSGGSSLDLENVACTEAEIKASGGSGAAVRAESINADASSGARIHVYGAHEEIEVEVSGGGEVDFP